MAFSSDASGFSRGGRSEGELEGVARVAAAVRAGVVSVPHGRQSANVNVLMSEDAIDPATGMARSSGIPVTLHPA
jgi:hypothetical protein